MKRYRRVLATGVAVLVFHELVMGVAVRLDLFSAFLSGGAHVPVLEVLALGLVLVTRIVTGLFLPGWIAAHLVLAAIPEPDPVSGPSPGDGSSSTGTRSTG